MNLYLINLISILGRAIERRMEKKLKIVFKRNTLVCSLHFDQELIIREDEHILPNGTIYVSPRQRAKLASNAIPLEVCDDDIYDDTDVSELQSNENCCYPHPCKIYYTCFYIGTKTICCNVVEQRNCR